MTNLRSVKLTLFAMTLGPLFMACGDNPCRGGFTMNADHQCVPEQPDSVETGGDTGTGSTWISLPDHCVAPEELGEDPLLLVARPEDGEPEPGDPFLEMLDLAHSPTDQRMYAVGQGGLIVWDLAQLSVVGTFPADGHSRYHQVELLSEGVVAVAHRDRGIEIVNVSGEPESYSAEHFWPLFGASGMAWSPPYLYVTSQQGELLTLEFKDGALNPLSTVYGLESPWEFVVNGSMGWIADNLLGVVPVDISNPEQPVIMAEVETVGGALDIVHHTNNNGEVALYVATGSSGVQVFSLDETGQPKAGVSIPYSTSVVSVAADGDTLWIVGHEDIAVLDISNAHNPIPLGVEETPGFGMHVEASGTTAWVADWGHLAIYDVDTLAQAPSMDLSAVTSLFGSNTQATLTLGNRGSQPLNLLGATSNDPRVTVLASTDVVQSGDSATLLLSFTDDGEPLDSTVCIASDDPEKPTVEIKLSDQSDIQTSVGYGEPAPDFTLTALDGESYRLSEQLGHPVVLIYFATW